MTSSQRRAPITLKGIGTHEGDLIRCACTGVTGNIKLDPLDKGLSGAGVLLAQWPLRANIVSANHVLKIGSLAKLQQEAECAEKLISPVDPYVGHIRLFEDETNDIGLLRQAFQGSRDGQVTSLKEWIRAEDDLGKIAKQIETLYSNRMRQWHCADGADPPSETATYAKVFNRRISRQGGLNEAFDAVGRVALEKSFTERDLASLSAIDDAVIRLNTEGDEFPFGLTHGDLHAQNVLVSDGTLQLIDFAWADYSWKALDFLMLECSLKFLVVPQECLLNDLVYLEELLETGATIDSQWPQLSDRAYAKDLRMCATAISTIRRQAEIWKAVVDFEQYRRGLVVLTSCLGTYPGLNRNYLAHSLAYHVSKLS